MFKLPLTLLAKNCINSVKPAVGRILAGDGLLIKSGVEMSKRFKAVCGGDCPVKPDVCKNMKIKKPKKSKSKKVTKIKEPFKSMWEHPDCCVVECVLEQRFDELHYLPTPKGARKYTKTWISCPMQIKPVVPCDIKYVCEDIVLRDPLCKPDTARPKDMEKFAVSRNVKCPKIRLRGCRRAREPPQCQRARTPTKCKKVKCPTKSFSECLHPAAKKLRKTECKCLEMNPCDLLKYLQEKQMH